jgi:N-acyl-D-aspartate/D-glutamate deacylase
MEFDLLVRNATVVDGSGLPRFRADVGVKNGRVADIGRLSGQAERTIDADGLILSPGFIDPHTHYDAQVNWDPSASSSCWHGVTSVIMGNCGHALAPCKPEDRDWYARCLERVEDIPVESMKAGIDWNWESFPEYLAHVERLPKGVNYGIFLGHDALRMYVMGERAFEKQAATQDDISRMRQLLKEALQAGALGFSSCFTNLHQTPSGIPVASYFAEWSEIEALVGVMGELNSGRFELAPAVQSFDAYRELLQRLKQLSVKTGRPLITQILDNQFLPPWQEHTKIMDETAAAGGLMYGLVATLPFITAFSLKSYLPFDVLAAWKEIRALPVEVQQQRFGDPEVRKKLVEAEAKMRPRVNVITGGGGDAVDPMRPDYHNLLVMQGFGFDDPSVADLAQASGQHPVEFMMDLMRADADQMFIQRLGNTSSDNTLAILKHPRTLTTFSDSGAHVGQVPGAPQHTSVLSYWVREKQAFTLEEAVRKMTFDIASAWEFPDRGLIRRGFAADMLLFDADRVKPLLPTVVHDLPAGGRRLIQKAEGIAYTMVNGQVTLEDGKSTGANAGQVLKGTAAH